MGHKELHKGKGNTGFFLCPLLVQTHIQCNTQHIITVYATVPSITP